MKIQIQLLNDAVPVPSRAHTGDAGFDIHAAHGVTLKPGDRATVPTGFAIAIPDGYAGLVLPRSGLASSKGLGVVNSPGLVDSGYRGEVKVVLVNLDLTEPIEIAVGDRIAQLVVVKLPDVVLVIEDSLPPSERAERGFGSSGN